MRSTKQVVFIMTDTTRHDMVGCYGNSNMITPNIDSLAKEGVLYEKAYSCQPVCGPARSAIFTGLYPHSNGSFTNTVPLYEGVKTIGEYLAEKDIHSAYIGKWHLDGGDYFGNGICPRGYDPKYWYDMRCYLDELTVEERVKSRTEKSSIVNGGIEKEFTFGHRVSNRALDFLEEAKDEDFFLTVSYDEPHGPYLCPEPYASMYKDYELPLTPAYYDTLEGKPEYQKLWAGFHLSEDKTKLKIKPRLFLGCNSFADYEIGRVIDKVKELAPNAMIIYTSDHGEALGAHSIELKGSSVYEEITHIPFIVARGNFKPPVGKKYSSVISHIDITPTILDYFGVDLPPVLAGVSMRPIISNPEGEHLHDTVFTEFHRYEIDHDGFGGLQFMRGAISDDAKLAIHLLDKTDEMYDTVKDPYELKNIINNPSYSEKRNEMHESILKMMNDTRDPYRGYQWRCRAWNDNTPDWECDGYTRQRPSGKGERVQLDYDTGLEIKETVRFKRKSKVKAGEV